ncbi:MAG: hypothetical protein KDD33_02035 [Bdellovibrionales bacterium]|nr:hypothetical protein [Bdellovibrionales bacterium]
MKDEILEPEVSLKGLQLFRQDPNLDFIKLARKQGLDVASAYAYRYFGQFLDRFRREMELQTREYNPENAEVDILIVVPDSSLGFEVYFKKFTQDMARLAYGCGFTRVQQIELRSPSVVDSARQLSKVLQTHAEKERQSILISLSFASATARLALDNLNKEVLSSVRGWLNFSGLIFGSPRYFLRKQENFFSRGPDLRSYSSEQKYFLKPMSAHSLRSYHFLSMGTSHQLSIADQRRRQGLKAWGPNDGFVAFESYKRVLGSVIPIWGQGPFIHLDPVHGLISKALCSLVCPVPSKLIKGPSLGTGHAFSTKP